MNAASASLSTSPAVRAYLRRATWGLPRVRQQEVWGELEEHLLIRAEQFQALGVPPNEALAHALTELGSPARVSAGMTQVYLMPKLLTAAGTAALALSAVLYAAAGGSEGLTLSLPVLTTRPVTPACVRGTAPSSSNITIVSRKDGVTCYTFTDPDVYQGAYLSLSSIQKAVTAQGGTAKTLASGAIQLSLPTPTGTYRTILPSHFSAGGEQYFLAAAVASSFYENQPSLVRLQGYNRPAVVFDNLILQFGSGTQPEVGPAFYRGVALELLGYLLHKAPDGEVSYNISLASILGSGGRKHQLKTSFASSEVVMLVTRRAGQNYDLDAAPVASNGQVTFSSVQKRLRFVSDPAQLGPYPSGGRINALLVRVTNIPLGNLKSGIFVPAQATSDAN